MADINIENISKLPKEIQSKIFDFIPISNKALLNKMYFREYIKSKDNKVKIDLLYFQKLEKNNYNFILNEIKINHNTVYYYLNNYRLFISLVYYDN